MGKRHLRVVGIDSEERSMTIHTFVIYDDPDLLLFIARAQYSNAPNQTFSARVHHFTCAVSRVLSSLSQIAAREVDNLRLQDFIQTTRSAYFQRNALSNSYAGTDIFFSKLQWRPASNIMGIPPPESFPQQLKVCQKTKEDKNP